MRRGMWGIVVSVVVGLMALTIIAVVVVDARRGITTGRDEQEYEDMHDDGIVGGVTCDCKGPLHDEGCPYG
jgi:hypothetical protein